MVVIQEYKKKYPKNNLNENKNYENVSLVEWASLKNLIVFMIKFNVDIIVMTIVLMKCNVSGNGHCKYYIIIVRHKCATTFLCQIKIGHLKIITFYLDKKKYTLFLVKFVSSFW